MKPLQSMATRVNRYEGRNVLVSIALRFDWTLDSVPVKKPNPLIIGSSGLRNDSTTEQYVIPDIGLYGNHVVPLTLAGEPLRRYDIAASSVTRKIEGCGHPRRDSKSS